MNEYQSRSHGTVTVGLDRHGEPSAPLILAADEAERRGAELAVITVMRPEAGSEQKLPQFLRRDALLSEALALQSLHEVSTSLRSSHPRLPVNTYCLEESEVGPDREPLHSAQLLVIGTHDRYGRQALSLGSLSRLLLTSSRCPVLAVPPGRGVPPYGIRTEPARIVVGVSEHPADLAVVHAAYAESIGRDCEVLLLHAYSLRAGESPDQGGERARSVLTDLVAQAPAGTAVSAVVAEDHPAVALLRLAAGATLIVLGGRTGALSGLIRESVSRVVLEAAPCPVLAVPRDLTAQPLIHSHSGAKLYHEGNSS